MGSDVHPIIVPHPSAETRAFDDVPPAVCLWNRKEERSLPNILPAEFVIDCERVRAKDPGLFELDERTLLKRLAKARHKPTATVARLRMKFWVEYDRAQGSKSMMRVTAIYYGICFQEHFLHAVSKPSALAWILCPPSNYIAVLDEGLAMGLERAREVLDESPVNEKGVINTALAELQWKITQGFELRKHGAVAQKMETVSKSLNVNVHSHSNAQLPPEQKKVLEIAQSMSVEDMESEIRKLEEKEAQKTVIVIPREGLLGG